MARIRHSILVNLDEQEGLDGLPWICWALYFALRSRMDFETGLVGAVDGAAISWQALGEEISVDSHQGLKETGTVKKPKLQRAMKWLVKRGLVKYMSVEKKLILYCPKAALGYSKKNKPDPNPTDLTDPQPGPQPDRSSDIKNGSGNNVLRLPVNRKADLQPDLEPDTLQTPKADQHQCVSVLTSSSSNTTARGRVDRCPLEIALLDECDFGENQIDTDGMRRLLDSWRGQGVEAKVLTEVFRDVRKRNPRKAFGPAYLEGPMADHLAGRSTKAARPSWAAVPVLDDDLWPWAKDHGYSGPGTLSYAAYRRQLFREVEGRWRQEKQL